MTVAEYGGYRERDLIDDLRRLGVAPGGVLLVQSSLRSVGPVAGGVRTVVAALRTALGSSGTLVVYTATPENSRSSPLHLAATEGLDATALKEFVNRMPGFDPLRTPGSPTMGVLSEQVRTTPGALRSSHPQTSFTALGPLAPWIVGSHPLEDHLGDASPLGRLYQADATALLIGVPSTLWTPYHLAEYRAPGRTTKLYDCALRGPDGSPLWISFEGLDVSDRHFPELDAAVRTRVGFREGRIGRADSLLLPLRPAVDAATAWLTDRRRTAEHN